MGRDGRRGGKSQSPMRWSVHEGFARQSRTTRGNIAAGRGNCWWGRGVVGGAEEEKC